MTSGASMMVVGVYLMLFGTMIESNLFHWAGLILATVGFCVLSHYEDEYTYRLRKLEKKEFDKREL